MSEEGSSIIAILFLVGIVMGALIGGWIGTLKPAEIVEWDYPVNPFTFTKMNPPEEAIRITITNSTVTTPNSSYYYEVYLWKVPKFGSNDSVFYWTYRQVIAP